MPIAMPFHALSILLPNLFYYQTFWNRYQTWLEITSEEKTGGEGGIRTPGTFRPTAFRVRRDRPLCHLSVT